VDAACALPLVRTPPLLLQALQPLRVRTRSRKSPKQQRAATALRLRVLLSDTQRYRMLWQGGVPRVLVPSLPSS
jgi:hypothetical protein